MTDADRYILSRFPVLTDPLAVALEVQGAFGREAPKPSQLHRVSVGHDTFPFTLTNRMIHFFGLEPAAEDCPFLLVYDAAGTLRYRFDKEDGEFVAKEVPAEIVGGPVIRPSVRVTFDSVEDAKLCAGLCESAARGDGYEPEAGRTLFALLAKSREARLTAVATAP